MSEKITMAEVEALDRERTQGDSLWWASGPNSEKDQLYCIPKIQEARYNLMSKGDADFMAAAPKMVALLREQDEEIARLKKNGQDFAVALANSILERSDMMRKICRLEDALLGENDE
jgi:hypothetical protein